MSERLGFHGIFMTLDAPPKKITADPKTDGIMPFDQILGTKFCVSALHQSDFEVFPDCFCIALH